MKTFDLFSFSTHRKTLAEPAGTAEVTWKPLYRAGAVAALLTMGLTLISLPVYLVWPPPDGLQPTASTVIDLFTIFQHNWLHGLFDLDLVMLIAALLMVPLNLALFMSLRHVNPSWMAIALVLSLMGSAAYLAINPCFTMLSLSQTYAASSQVQRPLIVAAGQATLSAYQGTGFDMYYLTGAFSLLIMAVVMLRSATFHKITGYLGLLTGILMLVPPTVGTVGIVLALLSLLPMLAWDLLLARRLWQLGRPVSLEE
jgi:Domain of unknown function (DUF4386)